MTRRIGETTRTGRLTFFSVTALASLLAALGRAQSPQSPGVASTVVGSAEVTGRVLEADATTPVANALVALGHGNVQDNNADRVLTDNDGRFFFGNLRADHYTVTAEKPGYFPGAFGRHRPNGPSLSLDLTGAGRQDNLAIVIWRRCVLTGRVLDDNGDPMVGVYVRAIRETFVAGRRQGVLADKARTDDRGVYRFSQLPPGDYAIALAATVTSEPRAYAGAVRAGGDLPHAFLQTMSGVATAPFVDYNPVTGITGQPTTLITSALAGTSVPPRNSPWMTYPTTYLPGTTAISSATVVHATSGRPVALPDLVAHLTPTYQVSGQVTSTDGPAAYFAVHLVPADAGDTPVFDTATAITDSAGAFTFFGVPPGQYVARVVRTPWPPPPGRGLVVGIGGGDVDQRVRTQSGGLGAPVPTEPLLWVNQAVPVGDQNIQGLTLVLRVGPRVTGRAEFLGSATPPTAAQWPTVSVLLEPASGATFAAALPGRFDTDGQFTTPSSWPTQYLIRSSAPPGWTFDRATVQGRDVSDAPVDLTADLDNVAITFTDHRLTISGTVETGDGFAPAGAAVLLFPVDSTNWVDYGTTSRTVRLVNAGPTGAFSFSSPPAGDYFLAAIPDEQAENWQDPAFLRKVSGLADRIAVTADRPITHALHLRRVQ